MKAKLLLTDSYLKMGSPVDCAFSYSHPTNRHSNMICLFNFGLMHGFFSDGLISVADPALEKIQCTSKRECENAEAIVRLTAGESLNKLAVGVPYGLVLSNINSIEMVLQETDGKPEECCNKKSLFGAVEDYVSEMDSD